MISFEHATKLYGDLRAVDDLCLDVYPGDIFGFLGPNGAGKTTAIRLLTGLTKPTLGAVWVNGFEVRGDATSAKTQLGVVQQHQSLDRELSCWECMELHARLHRMPRNLRRRRIAELLEYTGLTEHAEKLVMNLSGGVARRLQIARALLHEPRVLVLDEPTAGLDAHSRRSLWDLIRRMNQDGVTIFLTTHYIEEAENLCNRVGIIHKGRLIALGTQLELKRAVGAYTVEVRLPDGTTYSSFSDLDLATRHARAAAQLGNGPVVVRKSNLEDVFVELTGKKMESEAS